MKLYNKSELRYSRIFFDKKPPAYAFILIISTALVLIGALIGAAYVPKNYIVKANGNAVITGTEFLSVVSSGKVVTMHKSEGDEVKVGDVILSLSSGEEGLQAGSLMKQLEKLRAKEAIFQKFEQSLNEKVNHMANSGEEQEYYGKVEYYLSQLSSENYNNGSQYSKLQDEYVKLNKLIDEKNQLDIDLQTVQNELTQLQQQLATLPISDPTTTTSSSETPTPPPVAPTTDARTELETKIAELTTKIETIKTNITAKNSEIEAQQSSIKDLERTYNDPTSQAYTIYAQLISELGTARSNNNKSITELEANLGIATGQDKAHSILAASDGVLHYIVPLKQGMSIQQGQTVAEVSGKEKDYYVEAFVASSDISRVSKGAKVDVAITGVNSQKYGTLKGKVRQVDSGTIAQETKEGNISLYKVIIELESLTLKHRSETIILQKDMPVEVRIVYDKETYLDWILEILSFKQ
ncbi:HlyD family efflux transporter periplasmic adaptor subunit [Streptococcus suis]|uniref:HlyD family efflux transporter periplasmic adaptor subunit n=1 Tax=Streptococcus parasuis TaxID=1501662 RepID=UPI00155276BE|nr:HlyD family efflux transporter periplasmic adaptor subunit [Streptococcus suis]NQK66969.1 HlyD family efflux transporter periplasmic adaptor subunit [Streptococcus suis]NQP54621.1 HlyD family efflux transporter periplasmic adaptor subunit [Streptococcus suis]WNF86325.1 HlyD family efflux transporter periplasmic adaptor subunit [Streptococcus parasuis]